MSNEIEAQIVEARQLLGDDRVVAFLRASKTCNSPEHPFACDLVNEKLDSDDDFENIFSNASDEISSIGKWGFYLAAARLSEHEFKVEFGYAAGGEAGDGGEWIVVFAEDRTIVSLELKTMCIF